MIDINEEDVVLRRDGADGRFLLFTRTDRPANHPLPWFGVVLSTGGDAHGILVGLTPEPDLDAWAACDLLDVALTRARAEEQRRLTPAAVDAAFHVEQALRAEERRLRHRPGGRVGFTQGPAPTCFSWTVASRGDHQLPLCPDPESRDEGVTPEQLLILLDQLFADAAVSRPGQALVLTARKHVRAALEAERRRVQHLRS